MINKLKTLSLAVMLSLSASAIAQDKPLRLGVAGLSHGHLWEVISRLDRGDFEVVGVAERDTKLWENKKLREKVSEDLFFEDLEKMLDETKPEAVIVYESIYDHLRVVEACAPRGIHVMVEKPLAVSTEHSNKMASLARENDILLLTNYETTWYPSNHKAYEMIKQGKIGDISRMNIYDGHQGPIEIRCGEEFLAWLTDPVLNGGGAVIDFGCYGANLSTWLMNGQKPKSVYAVLKIHKPDKYPKVDDDATIVLEYANTTTVIMASWNWSMGRKDMHIYGADGYIYQDNPTDMRVRIDNTDSALKADKMSAPYNDSFLYLKAAVRREIEVKPTDLSSLENNLIVVEILEAAIESNKTGKPVILK